MCLLTLFDRNALEGVCTALSETTSSPRKLLLGTEWYVVPGTCYVCMFIVYVRTRVTASRYYQVPGRYYTYTTLPEVIVTLLLRTLACKWVLYSRVLIYQVRIFGFVENTSVVMSGV